MKRTPLGRSKSPLERRRVLRRRRPWRAGIAGDAEKRAAFDRIATRPCVYSTGRYPGRCEGPNDAHHVIPKRAIKSYAKTNRLDARSLASLLWDPSNGVPVCRRHHDLHEGAHARIPRELIPAGAIAFACALGLEHLIDRYYPTKETDDAS